MLISSESFEATAITEVDTDDLEFVQGAGWGGAMFGAIMGASLGFGPAGAVVGAIAGHVFLD